MSSLVNERFSSIEYLEVSAVVSRVLVHLQLSLLVFSIDYLFKALVLRQHFILIVIIIIAERLGSTERRFGFFIFGFARWFFF